MATLSLKDTIVKFAPTWLQDAQGAAFLRGVADLKDALVQQSKEGMKARIPELAPDDALDAIGFERSMHRGRSVVDGSDEQQASYALRLQAAWDAWEMGGTPTGMLKAFYAAGYKNVALGIQKGRWYTLDGSQNLVVQGFVPPYNAILNDVANRFWSTFTVLFFLPTPSWWSGTPPAQDSAEVREVRFIVKTWKPAFATCTRIVAVISEPIWGWPPGVAVWGNAGRNWGGGAVTVWTP